MVADGVSTSCDPTGDAQVRWAALHGLITLMPATPGFPWRSFDGLLERLIDGLSAQEPQHEGFSSLHKLDRG